MTQLYRETIFDTKLFLLPRHVQKGIIVIFGPKFFFFFFWKEQSKMDNIIRKTIQK